MACRGLHAPGGAATALCEPTDPLVDWLAAVAPGCGLAWDAGCGSGQLSVPLAARFERVIATDVSPEQLARAAPHPRVEYRCSPAEASGLPPGVADLAVAAQAAHWFDLDGYYAEVRRIARPGAIFALATYGELQVDDAVDRVVQCFRTEVLAPHWPPERRHVDDGYQSLPFAFPEIEPPAVEMRAEWTLARLIGYVQTWSAVRALQRMEGPDSVDTVRRELALAWGAAGARSVRWPLALRVGRVGS